MLAEGLSSLEMAFIEVSKSCLWLGDRLGKLK